MTISALKLEFLTGTNAASADDDELRLTYSGSVDGNEIRWEAITQVSGALTYTSLTGPGTTTDTVVPLAELAISGRVGIRVVADNDTTLSFDPSDTTPPQLAQYWFDSASATSVPLWRALPIQVAEGVAAEFKVDVSKLNGSAPTSWNVVATGTTGADFGVELPKGPLAYGSNGVAAFTVQTIPDVASEPSETYTVQLGNWNGSTFVPATGPQPVVAVIDPSVGSDVSAPAVNGVGFTEAVAGGASKSSITLRFSEPIGIDGSATPQQDKIDALKATIKIDVPPTGDSSHSTGTPVSVTSITGFGTDALTLGTNSNLQAESVIRVIFPDPAGNPSSPKLSDLASNALPPGETWAGGSGSSKIDLDRYQSGRPLTLRGNSGNDVLIGSGGSDSLIDGSGADRIIGERGGDFTALAEGGLAAGAQGTFYRDVVQIGFGESVNGGNGTRRDTIQPTSSAPTSSGFDIVSATAGNHDVLSLPAATIAPDTTTVVDGVNSTNTGLLQSPISKHSIANGIITFKSESDDSFLLKSSQDVDDAMDYLKKNFTSLTSQPGTTVAFLRDVDQDETADSLYVYQQAGTAQAGISSTQTMPATSVLIKNLIGLLDANGNTLVTLGNAPGPNVVQIIDEQPPEPINFALLPGLNSGMELAFDFPEPVTVTGNGGLVLKANGGSASLSFTYSGTPGPAQKIALPELMATDWVLLNFSNPVAGENAISDVAGRIINPSVVRQWGGLAIGGSAANTIDLHDATLFPGSHQYDIEAGAGNDAITGSAGSDFARGGTGADTVTTGAGNDVLMFVQGDSPTVVAAISAGVVASFRFVDDKADVITDFASGDLIHLTVPFADWKNVDGLAASSPALANEKPGAMPVDGLVTDERFFVVQGTYAAGSPFTISTTGADTLVVYDGGVNGSSAPLSQSGLVIKGVAPSQLAIHDGSISLLENPSSGGTNPPPVDDVVHHGTSGADTLDGGAGDDRVLLGAGGNDRGQGLAEGDVFIGGGGTDTAQLTGQASDYMVKRATKGQIETVEPLSDGTYESANPLFAIQLKSSSSGVLFTQSELIQFGTNAAVNPMTLVAGGALIVNSEEVGAGAYGSIASAIAAASDGATLIVRTAHEEPSGGGPITVDTNNLHIVLENGNAPALTFQLAELEAVKNLYLFGSGDANLIGNSHANVLVGNDGANLIDGNGGADRLVGEGGPDQLFGGEGDDWLDGSDGFDRLFGGSGNDRLVSFDGGGVSSGGQSEGDLLVAGSGNDLLIAGATVPGAQVRMMGGSGSDVFRLSNINGAMVDPNSSGTPPAQAVNAFIADLTVADGLDLSALRASTTSTGPLGQPQESLLDSGDYRISLNDLHIAGLQEVDAANPGPAPVDEIASGSILSIAMVRAADVAAAMQRAAGVPTMQALADQMVPELYQPLDEFTQQFYG